MTTYVPPYDDSEETDDWEIAQSPSLYIGRRSYYAFWQEIVFGIFVIAFGLFLSSLGFLVPLSLIMLGCLSFSFVLVSRNSYERVEIIPETKLTLYRGILNISKREIPLGRAEINTSQSFFQRMTNTGDITINIQGDEAEIFLYGYGDYKKLESVL